MPWAQFPAYPRTGNKQRNGIRHVGRIRVTNAATPQKHKEEFEQFGQMKLYRPYLPFIEKDIAPQDNPMLYLWEIK